MCNIDQINLSFVFWRFVRGLAGWAGFWHGWLGYLVGSLLRENRSMKNIRIPLALEPEIVTMIEESNQALYFHEPQVEILSEVEIEICH